MKKLLLPLALVAGVVTHAVAQNSKSLTCSMKTLSIPYTVQDASVNTFNVEVSGYEDDLNSIGYSSGFIADKVNLRAFTRVYGAGENKVIFRFAGFGNLNRGGSLSTKTEADGKVQYYYIFSYTLPMSYEIYAKGKRIAGGEVKAKAEGMGAAPADNFVFSTGLHPTAEAATNFWKGKGQIDAKANIKRNFEPKFAAFLDAVKAELDYSYDRETVIFGYFKTTKKVDYTDYENAAESAKRALLPLESGQPRTGLRSRLDSAITFWKGKISSLDPANKDENELFFSSAQNLSVAYYTLDDLDSSEFYLKEAEKADMRGAVIKIQRYLNTNRRTQLTALKANGIDPYVGPEAATEAEIKAIEMQAEKERIAYDAEIAASIAAEELKAAPVIETYDGYVIGRDDKKTIGMFKWYKRNTGDREDRKFFIADGTDKEVELSASFIKSCEFGSYQYETVKYGDGTGLGKEINLCQLLFTSDKIKVFSYDTKDPKTKRVMTDVYYKRPADDMATSTTSISFTVAFKNKLAKYFEDCPEVSKKALDGAYNDSTQMRVAAASDYAAACK